MRALANTLRIQDMPDDDRPREKLARKGAGALSDAELIAIFLRVGIQGMNAVELARSLLMEHGSLAGISRCGVEELARTKGLGPAKGAQLAAAFEVGKRLAREGLAREKLDSPELIYDLLSQEMQMLRQESLRVVLLNTKHHLIRVEEITKGTLNESLAHPREILRAALLYSAYGFILVHNHPSGDPTPSTADLELTRKIVRASELMQIKFHDHVIIGTPEMGREPYFSFREKGLM